MTTHHTRTIRHLSNRPPLPRPIQEHLGQQLRMRYRQAEDKPAYLGDPALPIEFELLLQRLEASERQRYRAMAHEQGVEAVERALRDLLDTGGQGS